jgi:fermentation-respiration switch protein FrsA (DUF1100 family)
MRNAILLFLSSLLLVAAGSAWVALYPAVPADLGGVANLDDRARRVRIPVGESDHLDGWVLPGARPATVVLFAGYARDHRRMWRYAHFLHRMGATVVTVDFRSARRQGRKPTTLGHWELLDARATLDWIRRDLELRTHRVALFGESLGGAVALTLAAERPDVAAVVADCPFASADAAIADGFQLVIRLPPFPLAPLARQVGRWVAGVDPGALDVTESLAALAGRPVLVVQTRREDRFSRRHAERIETALGPGSEVWTLEDVRHNQAWQLHRAEYERRVGDFLARHLGLPAPLAAPVTAERAADGVRPRRGLALEPLPAGSAR